MKYWFVGFVAKTKQEGYRCSGATVLSSNEETFSREGAEEYILSKADIKMKDLKIVILREVTKDEYNAFDTET